MMRKPGNRAFTLIELLMVVAILGILMIMLLPALSKAKGRSKQISCLSQLKQIGVGFISFAHEHGDRFPFQVPAKEGGTLELLQLARQTKDDVYYAYAHFQAISNEINEPKIFACPADFRTPADTMREMRNENLSYLIAVNAEFAKPDSLLAADRHMRVDGNSGSIQKITATSQPTWTSAGHEFKGNLLFAGGHAERTGNAGLAVAFQNPTGPTPVWIPTAEPVGIAGKGGASGSSGGSSRSSSANMSESERGFAMLQKFFDAPGSPSSSGNPPAGSQAQSSEQSSRIRTRGGASAPEIAASQSPVAEAARATNRPPLLAAVAPPPPVEDPETPVTVETAGSLPPFLNILLEPEQCWWCWWLILGTVMLVAFFLGWLIYRQRRRSTVADAWTPTWQVPEPPNRR